MVTFSDYAYYDQLGSAAGISTVSFEYPYPIPGGVQSRYQNKCVDGVSGSWVVWETLYIDNNGNEYPGSSFDAGTYRVQAIVHDRYQG